MCTRVTVVLFVCLCVRRHSSASLQRERKKLNLAAKSLRNAKGFQLMDFTKRLSFVSYSLFFVFAWESQPFVIH